MSGVMFVGDVGTSIELDTGVDITSATTVQIDYLKPGASTSASWDAEVFETTKVRYFTEAGDVDVDGDWDMQVYVEMPSWSGHGEVALVHVEPAL